jgi:hypothetical protein
MKLVVQQVADEMDQVKSLSFPLCTDVGEQAKASLQGINYDSTFADGFLHRTPRLTTTLPVVLIASKQPSGSSKEVTSSNGNLTAHFCGFTENVRFLIFPEPMVANGHFFQRALGRAYSGLSLLNTSNVELLTSGLVLR